MISVIFVLAGEEIGRGQMPVVPRTNDLIRVNGTDGTPATTLRIAEVTWVIHGDNRSEQSLVELDLTP